MFCPFSPEQIKKTKLVEVKEGLEDFDVKLFYSEFRKKIQEADSRVMQEDLFAFLKGNNFTVQKSCR
jgi:hypothetical protein